MGGASREGAGEAWLDAGEDAARRAVLRRVPFLRDLPPAELQRLARAARERSVPVRQQVFVEGRPCPGVWIVASGRVHIYKLSRGGRVQILRTCGPGEPFALVSALDGGPYPASAVTRERSVLLFIPRDPLLAALEKSPLALLAATRFCAERLRRTTCQIASIALCGVRARVAAEIAEEARAIGSGDGAGGPIDIVLDGRHDEVARRIGTVREVFTRALRALEDDGMIERRGRRIRILDLDRLRRIAAPGP